MRSSAALLLPCSALASADTFGSWSIRYRPAGLEPYIEENVSAWKDGGWIPWSRTALEYDGRGALSHAEAWSAEQGGGKYQGTWS